MLRLATMQDLTRIMAIVQATVMEMHAYGNYQWDEVYPTEQDFASDITQGDLFVSEAEGQICGLICINQTEPAVYACLLYTAPSPRDYAASRMPSSA